MTLTEIDARKLATRVAKESDGIVRFGKTNGEVCLHIRCDRQSETIYSEPQWEDHRWNRSNRPRKRQATAEIMEAVAN